MKKKNKKIQKIQIQKIFSFDQFQLKPFNKDFFDGYYFEKEKPH